jgi:hypothetical protein
MIRREVTFADGVKHWLLISQVEHARLSGVLAEKCSGKLGRGDESLDSVREELLRAITHHDDGWREWEQAPRLDPKQGRPLSFLELPVEEAIGIWERSIEIAAEIGNLAAWTVAGHFSALVVTVGDHAQEAVTREWLRKTAVRRSGWFADWHAGDEAIHTAELAGEALRWLQVFDILSLWPCSQYPLAGEQSPRLPEPFRLTQEGMLVREIRPSERQSANEPCRIVFDPWPFEVSEFTLQAAAYLVVAKYYASPQELLAAREPFVAEWVIGGE